MLYDAVYLFFFFLSSDFGMRLNTLIRCGCGREYFISQPELLHRSREMTEHIR